MRHIIISVLLGAVHHLHGAPTLVPNGDFETAGGADWAEVNGDGAAFSYSYPATEGNPDGYGVIDNTVGGSWGIWVANSDATISLDSLGLTAGFAYNFSLDMKILAGANIGGFKVDFFNGPDGAGSTGEMYPDGGGTTEWATYTFKVTIPAAVDGIRVVPLWGPGSSVGYDNVCVDPTPIPVPLIPNGDFENGNASWLEIGAGTSWSYPATGGNPDGYGVMTNDGTGFGIWVANGGAPLSLESLGLEAGTTVTFQQDMIILSGDKIGGLKVEFLEGATFLGDSGEIFPDVIGDGSTWETYSFEIDIPANADVIKVVPLWGKFPEDGTPNEVGFDNVTYVKPVPTIFAASIQTGTLVSWTASSTENTYQAQESPDNATWTDLGPLITGNSVNSVFDADGAAYYQVVETTPDLFDNSFYNPGFETTEDPIYPSPGAPDWVIQSPEDTDPADGTANITVESSFDTFSPNSGSQMLVIESLTPETGPITPPNTNVRSVLTYVDEDTTYDFSFHAANVATMGGANPQFNIRYYDQFDGYLGEEGFESFNWVGSTWTKVVKTITTPIGAYSMTVEWIQAAGADTNLHWVTLIDDVDLPILDLPGTPSTIAASSASGVEIAWPTKNGSSYQVRKSSPGLDAFADFGPATTGDGEMQTTTDLIGPDPAFYDVTQASP